MACSVKEAFGDGDYWILPSGKLTGLSGYTHLAFAINNLSRFGISQKEWRDFRGDDQYELLTHKGAIRITSFSKKMTLDGDKRSIKRQGDIIMDLLLKHGIEAVYHPSLTAQVPVEDFMVEFL